MDFEKQQEKLDKLKKNIKFEDHIQIKDFVDLIYYTIRLRARTIYDKGTAQQCKSGALRSREDIYRLSKYYLKEKVTLEDISNKMSLIENSGIISWHFCYIVKKRVYWSNRLCTQDKFREELKKLKINYE